MANPPPQQAIHTKTYLFIELMTNFHRKLNHIINIPVKERAKATFSSSSEIIVCSKSAVLSDLTAVCVLFIAGVSKELVL